MTPGFLMTRDPDGRFFAVLTREWQGLKTNIRCWPAQANTRAKKSNNAFGGRTTLDRMLASTRSCRKYGLEAVDCAKITVKAGTFRCVGLRTFGAS
jgi:hypothetical protein